MDYFKEENNMIDGDIKMCKMMYKIYSDISLNEEEIKELEKIDLNDDDFFSLFIGMH